MLFSFRQFLYWHKRSGGGGWNEAFFCSYAVGWVGSLQTQRSEITHRMFIDFSMVFVNRCCDLQCANSLGSIATKNMTVKN